MTESPPILRNSALTVPVAVAAAWAMGGPGSAVGAAGASALLLANLWTLSVLGPRVVQGAAAPGGDPWLALWGSAIAAKFLLVAGAFVALARLVPPVGLAFGFVPMLCGTLITALQLARAQAAAPAPAAAGPAAGFGET